MTPLRHDGQRMDHATTVDFASAARSISRQARRRGLVAPTYRCPPRLIGVDRSIRRRPDGAVIAVRLRDRPRAAVLADMIEGVVVTNGLQPPDADRVRADLWHELQQTRAPAPTPDTRPPATPATAPRRAA
jgi:hypothetical protein